MTFLDRWVLDDVQPKNDSDILIRSSSEATGESLILWLTRRNDTAPYYTQTPSFNLTYISTVAGNPSEEETRALDFLIRTIRTNDAGQIQLLQKEEPSILVLRKEAPPTLRGADYWPAVGTVVILVGAVLAYKYLTRKSTQVIHDWTERAVVLLAFGVAVFLRFYGLRELGPETLQADEARIGLGALSIMKYRALILNYASPHEPPLSLYYPIPFLHLFGNNAWALRIAPAAAGALSVLFTYAFAKEFFNRNVALIMTALMATSTLSITFSRIMYEHSFMPFFTCAFLYSFAKYTNTGRTRFLAFAGLMGGLGLSTKIIFLYFLVACLVAVLASGYYRRLTFGARPLCAFILGLLVGALPIFLYVTLPGNNFWYMLDGIRLSPRTGLLQTLWDRQRLVYLAFGGWFLPAIGAWVLYFLIRRRWNAKVGFCLVLYGVLLFESLITVSGVGIYHLLVFLPIPYAIFSGILDELRIKKRFVVPILAVLILQIGFSRGFKGQVGSIYNSLVSKEMIGVLQTLSPAQTIAAHHDINYLLWFLHVDDGVPPLESCGVVTFGIAPIERQCLPGPMEDIESRFRGRLGKERGEAVPMAFFRDADPANREKETMRAVLKEYIDLEKKRNFVFMENRGDRLFARLHTFAYSTLKEILRTEQIAFREQQTAGAQPQASLIVVQVEPR